RTIRRACMNCYSHMWYREDSGALTVVAAHISGREGPGNGVVVMLAVAGVCALGADIAMGDGDRAAIVSGGRIASGADIGRILAVDRLVSGATNHRRSHILDRNHLRAGTVVAAHVSRRKGPRTGVVVMQAVAGVGALSADLTVGDDDRAAVISRRRIAGGADVGRGL